MIELLEKYYEIKIDEYDNYCDGIIFYINSAYFYLTKNLYDVNYVENLKIFCETCKSIPFHTFIYNKYGNLISEEYILFKLNVFIEDINLDDINIFKKINISVDNSKYLSMDKLWEYRMDYLEKQIDSLSMSKLINYSFDYFVGIAEILILFYKKNVNNSELKLGLSHHNFYSLSTIDYYNPLNLCVDSVLKDYARFFKMNKSFDFDESLLVSDRNYLFVRLAFPFEYFNEVSSILLDNKSEKDLIILLNEVLEYENYLKQLEFNFGINIFSWIKKE